MFDRNLEKNPDTSFANAKFINNGENIPYYRKYWDREKAILHPAPWQSGMVHLANKVILLKCD